MYIYKLNYIKEWKYVHRIQKYAGWYSPIVLRLIINVNNYYYIYIHIIIIYIVIFLS